MVPGVTNSRWSVRYVESCHVLQKGHWKSLTSITQTGAFASPWIRAASARAVSESGAAAGDGGVAVARAVSPSASFPLHPRVSTNESDTAPCASDRVMSHRVVGVEMRRTDDVRRSRMYVYPSRDRRVAAKPRSKASPMVRGGSLAASMTKTPSGPAPAYRRSAARATSYMKRASDHRATSRVASGLDTSKIATPALPSATAILSPPVVSDRPPASTRVRDDGTRLSPFHVSATMRVSVRAQTIFRRLSHSRSTTGALTSRPGQARAESVRSGAHSILEPRAKNTW